MRHRIVGKKLGRDDDHRKALLRNLAGQVIDKEEAETTLAKAKYLRPYLERLITRAIKASKADDSVVKYNAVKYLKGKIYPQDSVKKLFDSILPRFMNVPGGYTKVTRTRNRDGDGALMARIEFSKEAGKKSAK
ncbi:50S ribosomal protein L17 [candidate division WWE3 bacterium RIFOXYC1_FULL_40_10]|uniref:50S ribosomal protein L17 n=1 Tax=candidate division WWE3 bacterium RIFOXYA2_FULL_46_9 TaxID=1802636 RepID=A0A1F4VYK7_UNCKA|nr:MAG: 50S ribosomal protein L17 [candidate division WWE3 bacterium RIFOXYB1_FULL_40_22]OGC61892.1 MAG: 50S ribosomal protein L17 [candidate division WWE3 bacterium RIFOXYA1_FULL_40_11]OGC62259.1 MAG: 50S ribosomal protein L17 [candidate division WWE3 bacterium RIFOXYA2_FULL_46_9]OGC64364.1 MAG: 50S ribosomal protein L17 [candidate division WWE3 bacterium RIFOXYB2_FULL_41_6]OGC66275.1 MAG: 50S ribosomal protein L17 [candidate division WWE3 bacterium RIFOXYC1_FULL_40_10]OGC67878.1 MAG: 50S rib